MLPGLRTLLAAIILSISILVFGLGAAALLRVAHGEFASSPAWRAPPEPVFAWNDAAKPALAMLQEEPPEAADSPGATEHSDKPSGMPAMTELETPSPPRPEEAARVENAQPARSGASGQNEEAAGRVTADGAASPAAPLSSSEIKLAASETFPAPSPSGAATIAPQDTDLVGFGSKAPAAAMENPATASAEQPGASVPGQASGDPVAAMVAAHTEQQVTAGNAGTTANGQARDKAAEKEKEEAKKRLRAERARRRRLAAERARIAQQQAAFAQPPFATQPSAPFTQPAMNAMPATTTGVRKR